MTTTAILQVVDRSGIAAWWWTGTYGGRHLDHAQAHPAASFPDQQPGTIPISIRHNGPIVGYVDYLQHGFDSNSDLLAVGVLDDLDVEQVDGLMCSAEVTGEFRDGNLTADRCTLTGLALVAETAGVGARKVRAFPGDFRNRWDRQSRWPSILDRAAKAVGTECRYSRPAALTIARPTDAELRVAAGLEPLRIYRPEPEPRSAPPRSGSGRWTEIPGVGMREIEYFPAIGHVIAVR